MRLNKFIAQATGISRRAADQAIDAGDITVNGRPAQPGYTVSATDTVMLDGTRLSLNRTTSTLALNKPPGYVCSRAGQGSPTIYELLPAQFRHLKPVGRLDKDSTGLLLLTDDGELAQKLTHPKYQKVKVYCVELDRPLKNSDFQAINQGIKLKDGISRLTLKHLSKANYQITMAEGKNRQIRRTFAAIGYRVIILHRIQVGGIRLSPKQLPGTYSKIN